MRIIFADIHGNYEALKSMFKKINGLPVENIYSLGDTWGYLPRAYECHKLINEKKVLSIRGNHEEALINPNLLNGFSEIARSSLLKSIKDIDISKKENIFSDISEMPLYFKEDNFLMIHGGWKNWIYLYNKENILDEYSKIIKIFKGLRIVFYGHTHRKAAWYIEDKKAIEINNNVIYLDDYLVRKGCLFINPGSLGQPRDKNKISTFMIMDKNKIEYVDVEYNVEKVIKEVNHFGFPEICGKRLLKESDIY